MRDIDVQRGYVLSDNYCDTHGFRRTGKEAWVRFRGLPHSIELLREVWVDCLGDYYVLGPGFRSFARLGHGDEVWDYRIEG